jgi:hypothetical protein
VRWDQPVILNVSTPEEDETGMIDDLFFLRTEIHVPSCLYPLHEQIILQVSEERVRGGAVLSLLRLLLLDEIHDLDFSVGTRSVRGKEMRRE